MPTETIILAIPLAIVTIVAVIAVVGWHRAVSKFNRVVEGRHQVDLTIENEAVELLTELGFEVLETRVEQGWTLDIDGAPRQVNCHADLLVEKNNRLLVADIKARWEATDPALPAARRKLLEYLLVFGEVDGVLVVDLAAGRVHEVDFSALLEHA